MTMYVANQTTLIGCLGILWLWFLLNRYCPRVIIDQYNWVLKLQEGGKGDVRRGEKADFLQR